VRGRDAALSGLVLIALLLGASTAHAACDWPVAEARAAKAARSTQAPLAIGDSTMIYAVKYLGRLGFDANARVCRGWSEGLDLVRQRKRAGQLPSFVVMALGANSPVRAVDVRRALALIGPKRTLGLVTHRTWHGKPGPDTRTIRRLARRHRGRVRLIDWVAYAARRPSWFVIDGLHTNQLGSRKFASLIARATPKKLVA
jgi:hypothetical protein